jgi:fused signal recognition particle receptor
MRETLRDELRRALERPPGRTPFSERPWVVFVVGVNGAGKTTTIGKLAAAWSREGKSVLLCAADTFRAAAAEQLETWAGRAGAASIAAEGGSAAADHALRSAARRYGRRPGRHGRAGARRPT